MSNAKQETIADIVAEMRKDIAEGTVGIWSDFGGEIARSYADRIEAAEKRMVDSIHRAMVIIAGIEMENSGYPPRLWTALEDAYDALSDALGTDGDTTADEEEAKSIGRHFVVKSYGNAEKMNEALYEVRFYLPFFLQYIRLESERRRSRGILARMLEVIDAALSAPPRNCDVGTVDEQLKRFSAFCMSRKCNECPFVSSTYGECGVRWSQMPYEGGVE